MHALAGRDEGQETYIHAYIHICSSFVVFWLPRHARAAGLINTYVLQRGLFCLSSVVRARKWLSPASDSECTGTHGNASTRIAGELELQLLHAVDTILGT